MQASPMPEALAHLVSEHGNSYGPQYPPDSNADHGPMACLALHGLGFDQQRIEQFAAQYQGRLVRQHPAVERVDAANWQRHLGLRQAYPGLRQFFEAQMVLLGWRVVLAQYLPVLISGWVKDAFHPLIRLAYGIEFTLPSEIASGLAYLSAVGNDPELAAVAGLAPRNDARTYLESLQSLSNASQLEGRFGARYLRPLERPGWARPAVLLKRP